MTRHAERRIVCEHCRDEKTNHHNVNLACPKCNAQQTHGTLFSKWLRNLPGYLSSKNFNNQNLDYIWLDYHQFWFITIEEKTNSGQSTKSQKQLHNLIGQMLQFASGNEFDVSFGDKQQKSKVRYFGHYIIQFENTNPQDSKWIKVNGKERTEKELKVLLMFGKFPEDVIANGY